MHDRILALGYAPPTIFNTAFPSADLKAKALKNGVLAVSAKDRNGASGLAALKTTSATAH
ncbi:hypothetical protein VSR68_10670 [Paraburkholderia phymatum]